MLDLRQPPHPQPCTWIRDPGEIWEQVCSRTTDRQYWIVLPPVDADTPSVAWFDGRNGWACEAHMPVMLFTMVESMRELLPALTKGGLHVYEVRS